MYQESPAPASSRVKKIKENFEYGKRCFLRLNTDFFEYK
jgi:hypothetical protein